MRQLARDGNAAFQEHLTAGHDELYLRHAAYLEMNRAVRIGSEPPSISMASNEPLIEGTAVNERRPGCANLEICDSRIRCRARLLS